MGFENIEASGGKGEKTPIEIGREKFEETNEIYAKYLDGVESFDQLTLVMKMNAVDVEGEDILFGEGENGSLDRALSLVEQMSNAESFEKVSTLWDEGLPGAKLRDTIKRLLRDKLDAEK